MSIHSSLKTSLKASLAQLGLVTLTVGGLSTPVLAHFSPIDQPLESDFFVGAAIDGSFVLLNSVDNSVEGIVSAARQFFVGKNLVQQEQLVAGAFGGLLSLGAARIQAEELPNGQLAQLTTPIANSKSGFIGAYLAYKSNAEGPTGLRLGSSVTYVREVSGTTTAAGSEPAPTQHAALAQVSESYTFKLGDVASFPLSLTQFAGALAIKPIAENSEITFALEGGLKLAANLNGFSPYLAIGGAKVFKENAEFDLTYGGGLALKATDNVVLKMNVNKIKEKAVQAGLGLDLLF